MLLGIDVGGTFTDAVLVEKGKVISQAKRPTTHENIMDGLLAALDAVLPAIADRPLLKRVALSTTLITNAVTAGRLPEVFLGVMPGPGANCEKSFPVSPHVVAGYIDHQGKIAAPPDINSLPDVTGYDAVAISGKFSVRNGANEQALAQAIGKGHIVLGQDMSGELGFIRRTNSAYYTAATGRLLDVFSSAVREALEKRDINAPLYILKANGATMPLAWAKKHAVEAFFTGPAASALGIQALSPPKKRAISLDIGGTTTDIAFWDEGMPLTGRRGAAIGGYPTAVRALHLQSVAIGGDSVVKRECGRFTVGPQRLGPAMALGGGHPTLTDAFLTAGNASFGDLARAEYAMGQLAENGESAKDVAEKVMQTAIGKLSAVIENMLEEWALQPVYRVGDIVMGSEFKPELIIGVGGAAAGMTLPLGEFLGLPVTIPKGAFVANAVGAAVSPPGLVANLRANTALGQLHMPQAGVLKKIDKYFGMDEAKEELTCWLQEQARRQGIDFTGAQIVWQEQFPVVRGAYRSGVIIDLCMQLAAGVLTAVEGGGDQW